MIKESEDHQKLIDQEIEKEKQREILKKHKIMEFDNKF